MGRALLENASFGPDTLKLLGQAFDEAWQEIGGKYGPKAAEDRRTWLALILLKLAGDGERDPVNLKSMALKVMRQEERPASIGMKR
jgi:hypothetical protein